MYKINVTSAALFISVAYYNGGHITVILVVTVCIQQICLHEQIYGAMIPMLSQCTSYYDNLESKEICFATYLSFLAHICQMQGDLLPCLLCHYSCCCYCQQNLNISTSLWWMKGKHGLSEGWLVSKTFNLMLTNVWQLFNRLFSWYGIEQRVCVRLCSLAKA